MAIERKYCKTRRALYRTRISLELDKNLRSQIFSPYFSEIYSDSLLLLNQYYSNNYHGCYLHFRCILENLYRHIYYSDHRQELWAVRSGASEYSLGITPQTLRTHLERVSFLSALKNYNTDFEKIDSSSNNKKTIFDLNDDLYQETSIFIHSSDPIVMNLFTTNSDLIFNKKHSDNVCAMANKVCRMAVIFLICMHFDQFCRFDQYQKSLLTINYNNVEKARLRKILGCRL